MAKKAKKAAARQIAAPGATARGFEVMAIHVTEKRGRSAFEALKADRPASNTFALAESLPKNLDPESAAKRILAHAFASDAMPSLVDDEESSFRSLGVETVPRDRKVAGSAHMCFEGIESESLLFLLDEAEVCASAASACASGAMEPSHVLAAMGVSADLAQGALRMTLGHTTTQAHVDRAVDVVADSVTQLRRLFVP